jgi:hypothetical protein
MLCFMCVFPGPSPEGETDNIHASKEPPNTRAPTNQSAFKPVSQCYSASCHLLKPFLISRHMHASEGPSAVHAPPHAEDQSRAGGRAWKATRDLMRCRASWQFHLHYNPCPASAAVAIQVYKNLAQLWNLPKRAKHHVWVSAMPYTRSSRWQMHCSCTQSSELHKPLFPHGPQHAFVALRSKTSSVDPYASSNQHTFNTRWRRCNGLV